MQRVHTLTVCRPQETVSKNLLLTLLDWVKANSAESFSSVHKFTEGNSDDLITESKRDAPFVVSHLAVNEVKAEILIKFSA